MKKLTLMLGALALVSSITYSKEVVAPVAEISKEVIAEPAIVEEVIAVPVVVAAPAYNIYAKAGLDVWSEYDSFKFDVNSNNKDTDNLGFEFALEATKILADYFELGLGVAYQNHAETKDNTLNIFNGFDKFEMPKYDSVPVYAVAKYNFNTDSAFKPYLKANLGYSFNFENGDAENSYANDKFEGFDKYSTNVKNGLYYGAGVGVEYNNFFTDVMYSVNEAKATLKNEDGEYLGKKSFDYSRVTLGFGYKFNF
ncbi:outer membrane beta-barrel protein [Cetobacterium sp.]|uniref:outer membrane beta-barrel protein n=1 Tax=Cetobacterium sp. TaxID=2071632 RepID=UPI003F3962D5